MPKSEKPHKPSKADSKARASVRKDKRPPLSAANADRHVLYQAAVQNVESEIDFIDKTYRKLRGRRAARLREDFCGTGNTSCEWVRRRPGNTAVGLDIHSPTLAWGRKHNLGRLGDEARSRIELVNHDVLDAHGAPGAAGVDVVLAMNFSYYLFATREELGGYFRSVWETLADDGVLFMDALGGSETHTETEERRVCTAPATAKNRGGTFTYLWEHISFAPVTGHMKCAISFEFRDGTELHRCFTYRWRLWTLPEIRELLAEAGFSKVTIYWEGDDGEGGGNGVYRPTKTGTPDLTFVSYISAEK